MIPGGVSSNPYESQKCTSTSHHQPGVKVTVNSSGINETFDCANLNSVTIVMVENNNAAYGAVLDGTPDAMISDLIEPQSFCVQEEGKPALLRGPG